jgi:hypothetical protein
LRDENFGFFASFTRFAVVAKFAPNPYSNILYFNYRYFNYRASYQGIASAMPQERRK